MPTPKFDKNDFQETLRDILKEYQKSYSTISDKLVTKILSFIDDGYPVTNAVKKAIADTDFINVNKTAITDAVYQAACAGYGVLPKMITQTSADNIKSKLLSESWAPDKMKLSNRLHNNTVYNQVVQTINSSMNKAQSVKEMAAAIYDGYNSDNANLDRAQLTKQLYKLRNLALQAVHGDKLLIQEVNAAADKFKKAVSQSKQSKNLIAAYNEFADACTSLKADAIDKATHVAVEEKTRYYAERIARTEASRAWFDGYIAERQDNEDVWGYKWLLSSRHHLVPFDQCDVCANMDIGFGKGIYPKSKVPSIPRHPHCMCMLEDVFEWEIKKKSSDIQPNNARKYIDSLSDSKKLLLFGFDGLTHYNKGGSWQSLLRGWSGFETPRSRLNSDDFKLNQTPNNDKIILGSELYLEQAKKRDHKIEITDIAISKVPLIKISEFSEEQNQLLQTEHKAILQIAKDTNDSNEVLSILSLSSQKSVRILGDEFSVNPSNDIEAQSMFLQAKRKELLYLHNHPSTNIFSLADIMEFIKYGQIGLLSVITNQGEIYILHKSVNYDYNRSRDLFSNTYIKYQNNLLDFNQTVHYFLKQCYKGGIYYEKSK